MPKQLEGFDKLSRALNKLDVKMRGKVSRQATLAAMLPALRRAQARAPKGDPPYLGKDGVLRDPYPVRNNRGKAKGLLRTPGFLSRNIARKTLLSRDKLTVRGFLGPKPEAFYGTQFVELGTSKMDKQPWLEPSFRETQGAQVERLKKGLRSRLLKIARAR